VEIRRGLTVLIAFVTLSLAGAASAGQDKVPAAPPAQHKPAAQPALIDINSASPAQLKTLPGIGAAEAARIVAGRPYLSKASLVTDHVIPAGVYQEIRHRIVAIQHTTKGSELNSDPS
jgi:DNA uptake protein ComE-like DNA-binding protein